MLAGGLLVGTIAAGIAGTMYVTLALSRNTQPVPAVDSPLASSTPSPSTRAASPSPTPRASGIRPSAAQCPRVTVPVSNAQELTAALTQAQPGDVIGLADGTYSGNFVATVSGTATAPIYLCGTPESILDGGGTSKGYVFHLDGARFWNLDGFQVTNGQKGVMADTTVGSVIRGLTVAKIGDEAVHLRNFSTDNLVIGNRIFDTGLRRPKFGEGIYIGTAESNWCDITGCAPDNSDRNVVQDNTIFDTTSESIDIKEGTTGGVVRGNTFDGSKLIGDPDSWVDVKGNGWLIESNSGVNSPMDGFQTHEILDGWGTDNVFRNNTAALNGPGYGYSLTPERANVVECNNTATGAAEGLTNVDCVG